MQTSRHARPSPVPLVVCAGCNAVGARHERSRLSGVDPCGAIDTRAKHGPHATRTGEHRRSVTVRPHGSRSAKLADHLLAKLGPKCTARCPTWGFLLVWATLVRHRSAALRQ